MKTNQKLLFCKIVLIAFALALWIVLFVTGKLSGQTVYTNQEPPGDLTGSLTGMPVYTNTYKPNPLTPTLMDYYTYTNPAAVPWVTGLVATNLGPIIVDVPIVTNYGPLVPYTVPLRPDFDAEIMPRPDRHTLIPTDVRPLGIHWYNEEAGAHFANQPMTVFKPVLFSVGTGTNHYPVELGFREDGVVVWRRYSPPQP